MVGKLTEANRIHEAISHAKLGVGLYVVEVSFSRAVEEVEQTFRIQPCTIFKIKKG